MLRHGGINRTYHVATSVEASAAQDRGLVQGRAEPQQSRKSIVADRPGHDRRYLLDSARIGRELGWCPEIGFEAGVRDTIRWYAANRGWWEPLRKLSPIDESAWVTRSELRNPA